MNHRVGYSPKKVVNVCDFCIDPGPSLQPEPEIEGCPVCLDGRGEYLGTLGNTNHFRCDSCGTVFKVTP